MRKSTNADAGVIPIIICDLRRKMPDSCLSPYDLTVHGPCTSDLSDCPNSDYRDSNM